MSSSIDALIAGFRRHSSADSIAWRGEVYNFCWLSERISHWHEFFLNNDLRSNSVVELNAELTPNVVAVWLALLKLKCIVVPSIRSGISNHCDASSQFDAEFFVTVRDDHDVSLLKRSTRAPLGREKLPKTALSLDTSGARMMLRQSGMPIGPTDVADASTPNWLTIINTALTALSTAQCLMIADNEPSVAIEQRRLPA